MDNAFFFNHIMALGGTESFLYYLAKKYKDRNITVYYRTGDIDQLNRLRKYVEVKRYNDEKIKCKKAIFNYTLEAIENVSADEYIMVIHADYKAQRLTPRTHPKIDRYIAVSQTAADSFKDLTGIECEVCYNPLVVDDKRPLILMSATRLTHEKGKDRIKRLAAALDSCAINYRWYIFTNDKGAIENSNIVYLPPDIEVSALMPLADYVVQLSDCEGYGLTVAEANAQGTPCIMTDLPVFKEIKAKGIKLPLDMSIIPLDKLKQGQKVKWTAPADKWGEILTDDKKTYKPPTDTPKKYNVKRKYTDVYAYKDIFSGETIKVYADRAAELKKAGVI